MKTNDLRRKFLDYFVSKGHRLVKSSSLVPHNDPSILFTNAGMNQFKHIFTGNENRDYKRAVSCQKCMRAGGKHNDLENVGYTARHHTFFEMLGNFSFGDYFKKEAIEYGWEFVTDKKWLGLPKEKLYVSVYKDDDEAFKIWNKGIGIDAKRIFKLGDKDNFWAMGETGPCGPCSEIFYDQGKEVGCGKKDCSPACDCDRHIEIWNLVFMEFNRDESGKTTKLPKPCIDTGMGLERTAAITQGVLSNYDIDIFKPIIERIEELSLKSGSAKDADTRVSVRAIADHARASTFLITEGIVPSNEGRGYVLRRIIRRAMRHGNLLGIKEPFLYRIVDDVANVMGSFYTELEHEADSVKTIIRNEEESFLKTLSKGVEIVNSEVEKIFKGKTKKENLFPGEKAFDLYSTYGFPLDLIEDALKKYKLKVDLEAFNKASDEHKSKAKGSFKQDERKNSIDMSTFNGLSSTKFLGYETFEIDGAKLLKKSSGHDNSVSLAFDKTCFYAESGGQIGDCGYLLGDGIKVEISSCEKSPSGVFIHFGKITNGKIDNFKEGQSYKLVVNREKRLATMRNHTATHLLHKALRDNLGNHVKQAGSLVEPERFRFDFSHTGPIPKDLQRKIEDAVNSRILQNLAVIKEEMPIDKAKSLGAMALFGEKYGDSVRVVRIQDGKDDYSIELCGGTHVDRTGDIGLVKILGEGSIASGIRRIEGVTGNYAIEEFRKSEDELDEAAAILKGQSDEVVIKLNKTVARIKELEKKLESGITNNQKDKLDEIINGAQIIGNFKVASGEIIVEDPKELRSIADNLGNRLQSGIVVLGTKRENKVLVVVKVSKDLTKIHTAKSLIQEIFPIIKGGGGGKEDLAEAGGSKPENLQQALDKIIKKIKSGN
jgi:alanyl-tRNA synthetase